MSCRYRSTVYHRSVAPAGAAMDHHPTIGYSMPHSASICVPHVIRIDTGLPTERTIPTIIGEVFHSILHAPTDTDRGWAIPSLVALIARYGWQHLPTVTDDDIRVLWSTVVYLIGQIESDHRPAHLPSEVDLRAITRWCWMHASDRVRNRMWECLHETESSDHPGVFDTTDIALRWGYPMWMHPDGLSLLETFFRQDIQRMR